MSIATAGRRHLWSWVDSVVLVGVNIPLALFWIGLVSDSDHMIQMATPIMGTCILLALLTFTLRLQSSRGTALAAT
jgi:Zn-dependent membrane protease YugP